MINVTVHLVLNNKGNFIHNSTEENLFVIFFFLGLLSMKIPLSNKALSVKCLTCKGIYR